MLREFVSRALCLDGVQMLRFLNTHAGAMTARDIAVKLFEDFVFARTAKSRIMDSGFYGAAVNAFSTPKSRQDSYHSLFLDTCSFQGCVPIKEALCGFCCGCSPVCRILRKEKGKSGIRGTIRRRRWEVGVLLAIHNRYALLCGVTHYWSHRLFLLRFCCLVLELLSVSSNVSCCSSACCGICPTCSFIMLEWSTANLILFSFFFRLLKWRGVLFC